MTKPYTTGTLTLSQLQALLEVYEGKRAFDPDSTIPVHRTRIRSGIPATTTDENFVRSLHDILSEQKRLISPNAPIPTKAKDEIITLLKTHECTHHSPEHLLAKRIGTFLHVDVHYFLDVNPRVAYSYFMSLLVGLIVEVTFENDNNHISLSTILILFFYNLHLVNKALEISKNDEDYLSRQTEVSVESGHGELLAKADLYAKTLQLKAAPTLFFANSSSSCTWPAARNIPNGAVLLKKTCFFGLLDDEEKFAILAHELSHVRDITHPFYRYTKSIQLTSIPVLAVTIHLIVKQITKGLSDHFEFNKDSSVFVASDLILLQYLLMFINKKLHHLEEITADNTAKALAGSLTQASGMRTLFIHRPKEDDKPPLFCMHLENTLGRLGCSDMATGHPDTLRRM